ncbi:MAG TPA: hypothetical protein VEY07_03810 [Thermoplasmata archaeon]|nr:hypothetical protein [Thermoplasmata archaeon]
MLRCPFCGSPETDRIDLDGKRFLVFRCLFTPEVDPRWDDARLASELATSYGGSGSAYFRGMCDRLHLYVTKGPGAAELTGDPRTTSP